MSAGILKDWSRRSNKFERLWLLAKIEFKLRYYENKLGLLWALIKPIMDIIIYYIVFQTIIKQNVPAYASYLFIGFVFWNFFVESTSGTIQILNTKKYLYEYSNMNKLEIYVSTLFANSIGFFFNFVMFLLFYNLVQSAAPGLSIYNLWIVPLYVNVYLLSLGVSLILSNIYIIAKDITQVWAVFVSMLFFLSPIIYKKETFEEALPGFDYINPVAGIIINARKVMMEKTNPDLQLLAFDFVLSVILVLAGLLLLNRLGAKAAEKL
ncbi:MAG: ABC transporter permease [Bacteroidota bacterium]|nr:ABC transporter permease [Bacteroidota bacterium]MDP4215180.1 ABC transporter permease [Bacteroidota bacterium]MDP4244991.1 ABC transporter permease [Bacteroidota bacterium]MDP4252680.1 ABC transporter permease [Bacteroidota bacterium]MDP4256702.1 ABC transporter permease [Bacteroidota bacterium]